jgi:hypothetical protein
MGGRPKVRQEDDRILDNCEYYLGLEGRRLLDRDSRIVRRQEAED